MTRGDDKLTAGQTRTVETLRGGHLREPPDGVLRRAIALRVHLPEPAPGLVEALGGFVRLLFDSHSQPLPVGVRGGAGAERRLLYGLADSEEADVGVEVDLRIRREAGGDVELTGQLLPPRPGVRVEVREARPAAATEAGETGEFLLRSIPGGGDRLDLQLTDLDGRVVVLPAVPLPPSSEDSGRA